MSYLLRIIVMVLAITLVVWVIDASVQALRDPGEGLMSHLLLGVGSTEVVNRLLITAVVLVLGTGLGLSMGRAHRAHEYRRSTERQLQTILDSMPELVLWFDADLRIAWANRAAMEANPDAIGRLCSEAFECTCSEEEDCACKRAMKSGHVETETVSREGIRGVDGTSYWEDVAVPLKGPEDQVVGIVGIGRDITERERVRRQLQFQAQLLSSVREAVIAIDRDRRIVYWNRGAEELFGYAPEETMGELIDIIYLPNVLREHQPQAREQIDRTGTWVGTVPLVRRDGTQFQAEAMLAIWRDEDEHEMGTIGLCRDITAEVETERAIRESERRYRVMFQSSHAMSLLIDAGSGRILDANEKATQFYGWSKDELLEMRIQDINTLSEQQVRHEMELAKKENRNHFFFSHRLASGELRDVEVYSGPIELRGRAVLYS
ncbi:MAG: PAS domain S-box protein, partial [Phycisphaerae bacterium]